MLACVLDGRHIQQRHRTYRVYGRLLRLRHLLLIANGGCHRAQVAVIGVDARHYLPMGVRHLVEINVALLQLLIIINLKISFRMFKLFVVIGRSIHYYR